MLLPVTENGVALTRALAESSAVAMAARAMFLKVILKLREINQKILKVIQKQVSAL